MTKIGIGSPSPPHKFEVVGGYGNKYKKINKYILRLVLWYFKRKGYNVTISNYLPPTTPTWKLDVQGTIRKPSDFIVDKIPDDLLIFSDGNIGIGA